MKKLESPYLITKRIIEDRKYNPKFGDDRECICGHPYYRHFDPFEGNAPVGCKYCHDCEGFKDSGMIKYWVGDECKQKKYDPNTDQELKDY